MEFKDYYSILGLERTATQPEIKRAYKKLARKYHPDVSSEADAEAKFKQVGEAYEVLKDPEKRLAYDQLGTNWQPGQDFNPPPDWDAGFEFSGGGFTGGDTSAYSDFFEQMFGRGFRTGAGFGVGGGATGNMHGQDHHAKVLIDLEDSYQGTSRSITLQRPSLDDQGRVTTKAHNLKVRIPKGVKAGQQIRLAGQGEPGIGNGKAGDLYLEIEFRPHKLYQIDGRDLTIKLPVTPWEAALGARIKVPTPAGTVEMKIPPNTTSGKRLRLKGKGIPGKPPGDLIVVPRLETPPANTVQERALYEKMQQTFDYNPRATLEA